MNRLIHQKNETLKKFIGEQRDNMNKELIGKIEIEQIKGNIRPDIKIEFIAYYINKMNTFIFDPDLIEIFPSPDDLLNEITKMFYFGVVKR